MFRDLISAYPELTNEDLLIKILRELDYPVNVISFVENKGVLSFSANKPEGCKNLEGLYCLVSPTSSLEEVTFKETQKIFHSASSERVFRKPTSEEHPSLSTSKDDYTISSKEDFKSSPKVADFKDKSVPKNVEGETIRKKGQKTILSFFNPGKK